MQKGYFPTRNINLTQGYGPKSDSHKNSYALDFGGRYRPFAPFDCKVTNIYAPIDKSKSREVWLTSLEKIECANGICDYLTISITHPAAIINMRLNQVFRQFEDLNIPTDDMTGVNNGPHCHIELSLGTQACWDPIYYNKKKPEYININKIKPEEYLFITKDTNVINEIYKGTNYNFIRDIGKNYQVGVYKCEYAMYLRSKPDRTSKPLKYKDLNEKQKPACIYKNKNDNAIFIKRTKFTALEIVKNNGEYWAKTYSNAYICIDDNSVQYCDYQC